MIYDSSTCLGYTLLVWWSLSTKIPHLPSFCIEIVQGSIYSLGIKQEQIHPGLDILSDLPWEMNLQNLQMQNCKQFRDFQYKFYSWTAKVSRQVGHYEVLWLFWISEEWNNANLKHDPDPDSQWLIIAVLREVYDTKGIPIRIPIGSSNIPNIGDYTTMKSSNLGKPLFFSAPFPELVQENIYR